MTVSAPPASTSVGSVGLARRESTIREAHLPGLVCGMCGIEPTVLGLAALRQMGAISATRLGTATSADTGGPSDRTVGYLAVRFDRPSEEEGRDGAASRSGATRLPPPPSID